MKLGIKTLLGATVVLAAAVFYFQGYRGVQACPLCMQQRYWHWAVVGVSALAFITRSVRPLLWYVYHGLAVSGSIQWRVRARAFKVPRQDRADPERAAVFR